MKEICYGVDSLAMFEETLETRIDKVEQQAERERQRLRFVGERAEENADILIAFGGQREGCYLPNLFEMVELTLDTLNTLALNVGVLHLSYFAPGQEPQRLDTSLGWTTFEPFLNEVPPQVEEPAHLWTLTEKGWEVVEGYRLASGLPPAREVRQARQKAWNEFALGN